MKKISFFIALLIVSIALLYITKKPNRNIPPVDYPVLLVGTNAEYKPFCFIDQGEIVGFEIDVIKEIAKRLNKQIVIKDLSFEALLPELQLGNLHIIAAAITPTEKRSRVVLFAHPHFSGSGFVLYTKNESTIKTIEDLKNKTVAVNEGYITDTYISQYPNINVLRLSAASIGEGILALQAGRADAFLITRNVIKSIPNDELMMQYNEIEIPNTIESSAFAISKYHSQLLPLINQEIDLMKNDGTLEVLAKKWDIS